MPRIVPRAAARALRLLYVLIIAYVTLRGLQPDGSVGMATARLFRALHPGVQAMDVVDGVRNVALFAGLGAVWLATTRPGRLRRALGHATIVGALLSLGAETAQLFSPTRMSSVLDLATNTFGAFLGAFTVALAVAAARSRPRVPLAPTPLALVAVPYAAACLCEAFSPLDRLDRVPGAWGGVAGRWAASLAYLQAHPHAFGAWTDPLLALPLGGLLVCLWVERGGRAATGAVAAVGAAALAWSGVEALRGMSGGDMAPWAVALRVLATIASVGFTARWLSRRDGVARVRTDAARWGLSVLTCVLLLWSWRPLVPLTSGAAIVHKLGRSAFIPMAALADLFTLHSAVDVAVGFLLYVPLGAWLAGRGRGLRAVWPGFALAVISEAGQLFVASRTVDVTDAIVQAAGIFVGWAVVRQADAMNRARVLAGRSR